MSCSIGKFKKIDYQLMLNKYSYHRMLLCLLGKRSAKILEMKIFSDLNAAIKERDYAQALKA